jgi:hypothetical protein
VIVEPEVIDDGAGNVHAEVIVFGGTPPYTADVGTVVGTAYSSPAVPQGQELEVVITDSAGCRTAGRFVSEDSPPCDLPCDGDAVRQGHRFWLPEARQGSPINGYGAEVRRFTLTRADGTVVDLDAAAATAILRVPQAISANQFAAVVTRWLTRINRLIASKVGSDQWLRFEYTPPAGTATTGTLHSDRLACLDFTFDLTLSFVQNDRRHQFEIVYSAVRGTTVADHADDSKVHIPPFDVSTSNKCRPDEPPVPQCTDPDLRVDFTHEGVAPGPVTLTAAAAGRDRPVAYLWEITDGKPAVTGGEEVRVEFSPVAPAQKLIRLTAYTPEGCTVTAEKTIDITQDGG